MSDSSSKAQATSVQRFGGLGALGVKGLGGVKDFGFRGLGVKDLDVAPHSVAVGQQ